MVAGCLRGTTGDHRAHSYAGASGESVSWFTDADVLDEAAHAAQDLRQRNLPAIAGRTPTTTRWNRGGALMA